MLDKVIRITEKKHKEHKKYENTRNTRNTINMRKGFLVFLVLLVDNEVAKIGFVPLIFQIRELLDVVELPWQPTCTASQANSSIRKRKR